MPAGSGYLCPRFSEFYIILSICEGVLPIVGTRYYELSLPVEDDVVDGGHVPVVDGCMPAYRFHPLKPGNILCMNIQFLRCGQWTPIASAHGQGEVVMAAGRESLPIDGLAWVGWEWNVLTLWRIGLEDCF